MMKKLLIVMTMIIVSSSFALASDIKVVDGVITSAIEKQMPIDRIDVYPADYGKLYCFTRVVGAQEKTQVTHVWYYQNEEMARVSLAVGSSDWRTYSSKRFLPQWAGDWKVVVLDAYGNEISIIPFRLE